MEHEKLWDKFIGGDKTALSLIFRSFFDELYHYGLKITHHSEVVDDSLQDLFFKLWKNRNNLRQVQYPKAYLYKALRRHILGNLENKRNLVNFEDPPEELFDIEFSHEDFLINEQLDTETRAKLIHALNTLSQRQKEAIYLRYFKNLGFETIADIMSMNVQSVRNSIQRGLSALREIKGIFL